MRCRSLFWQSVSCSILSKRIGFVYGIESITRSFECFNHGNVGFYLLLVPSAAFLAVDDKASTMSSRAERRVCFFFNKKQQMLWCAHHARYLFIRLLTSLHRMSGCGFSRAAVIRTNLLRGRSGPAQHLM